MAKELPTETELRAEKAENLSICKGFKLLHVRDGVEKMLSQIGRGGIFEEYTRHDISHVDEMLGITQWLIPKSTQEHMTSAEWLMLTLSIYFHDLGMVVTKEEYENRQNSGFANYKNQILKEQEGSEYNEYVKNTGNDEFLYQEFVREKHAVRIRHWIEGKDAPDYGDSAVARKEVGNLLTGLDEMFKADLAMICESHHKDNIDDFSIYKTKQSYGNSREEEVNLNYIAVILRVADLLHITKDRTPAISRRLISVRNPKSVLEWEKQQAVRAVKPMPKRNENGDVDETLQADTIGITAYFDGAETAEAYFGLSAYLQYTGRELTKCADIVEKAQKQEGATRYLFPWREIDESGIDVKGFETKKLSFTIAQDNILQLLVGHTLYNDSSVVVRELVQNGVDAVRLQIQYDKLKCNQLTNGKIQVDWNEETRELSFWDNGTGMSIRDVRNYLLKVGASKYREETIRKQFPEFSSISHFGIGILTCFMIADDIDILTNSVEEKHANSITLRKVTGNYLLKKIEKSELDERIKNHGTVVKLHVRYDVDMSSVENDLRKWIVLPEIPVYFTVKEGHEKKIGYDSLKEVLVKFLEEMGCSVDDINYSVCEETKGNVTIAYAVKFQKYMLDWSMVSIEKSDIQRKVHYPVGTCVEGIRVEFNTPGYKNIPILAIANIKNSQYKTNVARSAIELDANKEILRDIYDVYRHHIQSQMDKLEMQEYSQSWALSEGEFLMHPLVRNLIGNNQPEPMDDDVLINTLAKLKCIALENDNHRVIVSAEEVSQLDEINIFQCELIRAAEKVLKETRNDATLSGVIGNVCPKDNFLAGVKNVICNYDKNNILHEQALKEKEICGIDVAHARRRIRLTYSNPKDLWYSFHLVSKNRRLGCLYIPKKEFRITGLQDEVGVRAYGNIYIESNTGLYNYLIKLIATFRENMTDENELLLAAFLTYLFGSRTLEYAYKADVNLNLSNITTQFIDNTHFRMSEEMVEKMWSKIDKEEFAKEVLTKTYQLYSTDNWLRSEMVIR